MNGMVTGTRNLGLKLLAALCLSLALVSVFQVASADAASARRPSGGYGDSRAYCHSATRQIEVQSWVYQDNGGRQTLGRQVLLLNRSTNQWFTNWYEEDTTFDNGGTIGRFGGRVWVGAGTHDIVARYWFLTTAGWQSVDEYLGYCKF